MERHRNPQHPDDSCAAVSGVVEESEHGEGEESGNGNENGSGIEEGFYDYNRSDRDLEVGHDHHISSRAEETLNKNRAFACSLVWR